jgi:hypothetical protein
MHHFRCLNPGDAARLLDEEPDDTLPASDPPSWTMDGSVVSRLRH